MSEWHSTDLGKHLSGRMRVNTVPEMLLRRALHACGGRYRLHVSLAKGCTPDLVMPSRRLAIFVDGCYWHSCPQHGRKAPFTGPNAALWEEKMLRNKERDHTSTALAEALGWIVIRTWECEVKRDAGAVAEQLMALPVRGRP